MTKTTTKQLDKREKNWNESFKPSLRETEIHNPLGNEAFEEQTVQVMDRAKIRSNPPYKVRIAIEYNKNREERERERAYRQIELPYLHSQAPKRKFQLLSTYHQ